MYAENVGKPKNVQELEELLRTNRGLMNNCHTHPYLNTVCRFRDDPQLSQNRKTVVDHPKKDTPY